MITCKECDVPDVNCNEQCKDCFGAAMGDCEQCKKEESDEKSILT